MDGPAEMRRCLFEMDVEGLRRLWSLVAPNMPQPKTDYDALCGIHYARSQAMFLPARSRFYSHRWLLDHNLPTGLPDNEKPSAERMFPRIESGVGISVNALSEMTKPIAPLVRGAMEDAVQEVYADGKRDDIDLLKQRMTVARSEVMRKLLGKL